MAKARLHLVLIVLTTLPVPALADHAQTRRGFWWSFGAGFGSAQARCDQCTSGNRVGSFSGTIRLGGTIGEHLLLGWEGSGWLKNDSGWLRTDVDVGRTLGNSSVIALYYPRAASGFFLKAGAGASYAGFPPANQPVDFCLAGTCYSLDEGAHGVGFGITVGLGYDLRIRPNLSLTPEFSFALGLPRDLKESGKSVATGWKHDIVALNLCLTFH